MRKTKVKEIRKLVVTAFAMFALATGVAFAYEVSVDNWDDALVEVQKEGVTKLILDVSQHSDPLMDTMGSSMNITSPPVPGNGIVIEGKMEGGHSGYYTTLVGNGSQILNNSAKTTVNNVSFKSGSIIGANGGAIVNTGDLTLENTDLDTLSEISSNNAIGDGGAIANINSNSSSGRLTVKNYIFSNNIATNRVESDPDGVPGSGDEVSGIEGGTGGAIYSNTTAEVGLDIGDTTFTGNKAKNFGGAIANLNGIANITSSRFESNAAGIEGLDTPLAGCQGGAIVNAAVANISSSLFKDNTSADFGGAIANSLSTSLGTVGLVQDSDTIVNISSSGFTGNLASEGGGAIYNKGSDNIDYDNIVNIDDGTYFIGNFAADSKSSTADLGNGGAILNMSTNTSGANNGFVNINGTEGSRILFQDNIAGNGGAIANQGNLNVNYATFTGNGIHSFDDGSRLVTQYGGAIYNITSNSNQEAVTVVKNSAFDENIAVNGGAIYNDSGSVVVLDSTFTHNMTTATGVANGGAIYGANDSNTIVRAHEKDASIGYYQDSVANSVNNGSDSVVFATTATGSLQAGKDRTLTIYSIVDGNPGSTTDKATININDTYIDASGDSYESTGVVRFVGDAQIRSANIVLNGGTLAFDKDSGLGSVGRAASESNSLTLNGGTLNLLNNHLSPDNRYTNQLVVDSLTLNNNTNIMLDVDLKKTEMDNLLASNVSGTVTANDDAKLLVSGMKSISDTDKSSVDILFTDIADLEGHVGLADDFSGTVEGPIYQYAVQHLSVSHTGGGAAAAVDPGEYFRFNRIGNSNSVIAGPVAAQAAFLLMDNIYRQSFANMDMVTLMTPEQRMAWKMRNKYANADLLHRGVYAPNIIPEERDGWYLRPFTNFENVPLKNGPKVSNVFYGTLIGGESDIIDLGHGWDGNFSFFGAYHGSHQAYNGNSIWQNGGSIGGVATAYKGNFFTGVTANVGASAARATHSFGSEDFPILMTGAAWKSGYNWGLLNNKLVIQPSYMMSYTFVNVFDYTNAAGVNITQDPLHAIEFIPGIKIIGNLPNGWQPYAALNMTWIAMDRTKFYANDVALTRLGIKPFVEYGVGLQKRYGDRFTGFGQAMIRNGGRNGIAFTLGFRWALGN